jgi:hypothetical protein
MAHRERKHDEEMMSAGRVTRASELGSMQNDDYALLSLSLTSTHPTVGLRRLHTKDSTAADRKVQLTSRHTSVNA